MASSTDFSVGAQRAADEPRRCAVIGHPIAHSLSPLLHRTAYAELGLGDAFQYDAFDVSPNELDEFIAGLGPQWVGLSVTAPHKEALLAFGEPHPLAADLRAANTLILGRDEQPNRVFNTDVTGFCNALAGVGVTSVASAILVGAGATARSALAALRQLGLRELLVLARDEGRAVSSLQPIAAPAQIALGWRPLENSETEALPEVDLLISTVPTNLPPTLARELASASSTIFEAVYNYYPSNLDQAAQAAGKPALNGMHLLVYQALDQIELMTGHRPAAEPLLDAGLHALLNR